MISQHKFILEAGATGKQQIDDVKNSVDGVAKSANKFVTEQTRDLNLLQNAWVKAAGVVAGVAVAINQAWDMAKTGAKADQQAKSFDNLVSSYNVGTEKILGDLKKASAGTVNTMALIEKAGTSIMMGIDPTKVSKLMEIARVTSRQTGQEVEKSFADISLAVARQSNKILDNLGIIVNVEKANENWAKVLGKSADKLNEAERAQAFMNATVEAGDGLMKRLGNQAETTAEKMARFEAGVTNAKTFIGQRLAFIVTANMEALEDINKWIDSRQGGFTTEQIDVHAAALAKLEKDRADLVAKNQAAVRKNDQEEQMRISYRIAAVDKLIDREQKLLAVYKKSEETRPARGSVFEIADELRSEALAIEKSKMDTAVKAIADGLVTWDENQKKVNERLKELAKAEEEAANEGYKLLDSMQGYTSLEKFMVNDLEEALRKMRELRADTVLGQGAVERAKAMVQADIEAIQYRDEQNTRSWEEANEANLASTEHFLDRMQDLFVESFKSIREGGIDSFSAIFSAASGFILDIQDEIGGQVLRNVMTGKPAGAGISFGAFNMGGGGAPTSFWNQPLFGGANQGYGTGPQGEAMGTGLTRGQGAGLAMQGAATIYDIYQQSGGMSRTNAAASGIVAGGASGALAGGYASSWSGPYAIIGAAVGAILGGITGYLGGADAPEKAKFRLGAGSTVNMRYPNVETPFGQFGFDQASVIDTNRFKAVMSQVGEATNSLADVMDSASIERITSALSAWRSGSAKGDISAAEFEEQFKNYFAEIGEAWNTGFGDWMMNFNGTLDDLIEGIQRHVEAIQFTSDILDPQPMTEYDTAAQAFNDSVNEMRGNLKDTGGTIQELTDLEAARAKGLADLKQGYIDSFEGLKMQLSGMKESDIQLVQWAKKFGTTVPAVIADWNRIEAAIQAMDFDAYNDLAKAAGGIDELNAMLLGFNSAADATAAAIYDINLASGQMAGLFSDLDVQIMNINGSFDAWIVATKDLANATEIATALEERRTEAIQRAENAYLGSISAAQASLQGISENRRQELEINAILNPYGITSGDISQQMIDNLNRAAGQMSESEIQAWVQQNMPGVNAAQLVHDVGELYSIYHDGSGTIQGFIDTVRDATEPFRNAANAANDAADAMATINDAVTSIDDLIFRMTGGDLAPVQSAEFFNSQYAALFQSAQANPANVGAFTAFIPQMLDWMSGYGADSAELTKGIISDLTGLRSNLSQEEITVNVSVYLDGQQIGDTVAKQTVSNANLIRAYEAMIDARVGR